MSSSLSSELVIQTSQLDTLLNQTNILLVFIGSEEAFREAHIPGSQHIKPSELVCGVAPAAGCPTMSRQPEQLADSEVRNYR